MSVSAACNALFDLQKSHALHAQKPQCTVAKAGLQKAAHVRVASPLSMGLQVEPLGA